MKTELQLRPYQSDALAAIHGSDKTRQLISLPTGSGKTVLFAAVARDRGPKALIIAHRTELISQAAEKLEHFYPEQVGILQAGRRDLDSPVLVASIQTAMQHIPALSLRRDRTLIIDEAHHVAANTYRKLAQSLGFMINHPGRLLLGVTATPSRGDGIGLDCVFEEIAYQKSIVELMAAGYLADLRGIHIKTHSNLIGVSEVAGDFSVGELARKINTPERNNIIVDSMFKFGRVPAVAFCADIQHSLDLAKALSDNGYRTATVTGKTPKDERAGIIKALASGDLDIVTNCNVLTEGFDCSALRCLIMARPTKSETLYTQMIGRGTRLHPGKTEALVLEFNDNRPDIVDISTLAGKPIKEGESLKESILRAEKEMEDQAKEEITGVTYHPFEVIDFSGKSARLPGLDPDGLAMNQELISAIRDEESRINKQKDNDGLVYFQGKQHGGVRTPGDGKTLGRPRKSDRAREKYSLTLDPAMMKLVDHEADSQGLSRSEFVNLILENWLESLPGPNYDEAKEMPESIEVDTEINAPRRRGKQFVKVDWVHVNHLLSLGKTSKDIAQEMGIHPQTLWKACERDHKLIFSEYARLHKINERQKKKKYAPDSRLNAPGA